MVSKMGGVGRENGYLVKGSVVRAQSLIPMVQGVLRIFGTSPSSLFSRFPELTRTSGRGLEFQYQRVTDRSGSMSVRHDTDRPLHRASFLTSVPALELMFRLCGIHGRVGMPELQGQTQARYRLDW